MPITYLEIEAYQRVTDTRLTPFDVALILTADGAFQAEAHERSKPTQASSEAAE